jgi:hypothetical protein
MLQERGHPIFPLSREKIRFAIIESLKIGLI